eukprot:TRINITY_DN7629_c0_g1_i1.p1 TRINITY_DN7629_c0_g1~~TRINITY_DN7629_c0_g1_i1.p1  ORF type:complete len:194 (-),score=56.64 TRINITY_DN7629_c0_g1_i1:39-536(-)
MELTIVGLQNAGKTTLVNQIATGEYTEDTISTIGFNMKKITRGNVVIKLWDIGGQPRFRSMWERYCSGVGAIVYVVDSADREAILEAKQELGELLDKNRLRGIPLLVLGNKSDLPEAIDFEELIEIMELHTIEDRDIGWLSISAKDGVNIDKVLEWLVDHSGSEK